jgi:hypothetical protein
MTGPRAIAGWLLLPLLLAGCPRPEMPGAGGTGDADRPPRGGMLRDTAHGGAAPPAAPGEDTVPAAFEGTVGTLDTGRPDIEPALLREVRTARHPGFDRVVFELEGDRMPGYHLEYIDRPVRQCGSGDPVPVRGDGYLRIRLDPAHAHVFEGERPRATGGDRDRRGLDHPNLVQLTLICDFEAQVEWVLGLRSPEPYRVLELREPTRLVLDVRHP